MRNEKTTLSLLTSLPLKRMWSAGVLSGQSARLTSDRETKYWNLIMEETITISQMNHLDFPILLKRLKYIGLGPKNNYK